VIEPRQQSDATSRTVRNHVARIDRLIDAVRIAFEIRPADREAPVDDDLVMLAITHGVRAEVARAAQIIGATDDATALLTSLAQMDAMRSLTARAGTRRVVADLEQRGVPALVMKGVALGVQTGRGAADRPGTDVDLLVRPDDWQRAHEYFVSSGYESSSWMPPPRPDLCTRYVQWSYHEAAYRQDPNTVDLHWRLGPGHCDSITAELVLARRVEVDADGVILPTLHPDDALVQTLLHGAKDGWCRLRSVVDAHLLSSRTTATWKRATELLPGSRVVGVGRAGVEHLRDPDRSLADRSSVRGDALATWASGLVSGHPDPADTDAWSMADYLAYVRRRASLTPSVMSTSAVIAGLVLSPRMIATSRLDRRWWPLILLARPVRAARRLVLDTGASPPRKA
jgi:hypothetical protein